MAEWEDSIFAEIDLGSEHRGQLLRQHRAYGEYYQSGAEQAATGVFPGVVWIVPNERRAELFADVAGQLPEPVQRLFSVTTRSNAIEVLCGEHAGVEKRGELS